VLKLSLLNPNRNPILLALIQPYFQVLMFRAGPQDMPASLSALKFTLIACFLTDVIGATGSLGMGSSMFLSAGQIALMAVFVFLLLKINKKEERWLQTLIALFGALALINLATYPFIRNLDLFEDGKLVLSGAIMVVAGLQLWFFIVMAKILKAALEVTMGRAVLLTFLIINIVPMVLSMLMGILGLTPAIIGDGSGL